MKTNYYNSVIRLTRQILMVALGLMMVLLIGCSSTRIRPAIVTDTMIENPSVGFHGYQLTIPAGIQICDLKHTLSEDTLLVTAIKKAYFDKLYDRMKQQRRSEIFVLQDMDGKVVVLFAVGILGNIEPFSTSTIESKEGRLKNLLESLAKGFSSKENPEKHIVRIGNRYLGFASGRILLNAKEARKVTVPIEFAIALGSMKEIYVFMAIGGPDETRPLRPIVEELIQNLRY